MKKPIFLILSLFMVLSMVLAACQPAATPAPAVTEAAPVATEAPAATVAATEAPAATVAATTAPAATEATPILGGNLIFARAAEAQGLDPQLQTAFSSFVVLGFIYEPLFTYDDQMNIVGLLADTWSWSDDALTLTVKLRQNVKFHNGDTMTADDVKFSFDRVLNEKTGAAARSYFTDIKEVNVVDPNTVAFVLTKPNATVISGMTVTGASILDKKLIEGGADPAKTVVGTGPFMLKDWQPDKVLLLAKNPDYWMKGLPYLDTIEMRVIPDESAILAGLRAGEIDFAQFNDPSIALTAAKDTTKLTLLRQPSLAYHVLQLNPARDPFKNEKVRQAVSCAIDRQQVIDSAALGEGKVTPPITNPFFAAPLDSLFCYKPDIEKAKQLLADSGAKDVTFTIMAASDEPPTAVAEAQSIQAQLANIGITVKIETLELGVYVQRWLKGDFDATIALNGGGAEPALELGRYWKKDGTFANVSNYQTDDLDKELKAAEVETNPDKRKAIYLTVQQQLAEASPWIWLYMGYDYRATSPRVQNFIFPPEGTNIYLRQAWLSK
jgi:peptide/nickel transport system substrate-binding protein